MDSIPITQQKQIVIKFLQQANHYAEQKIEQYQKEQQDSKKEKWQAYKDFNDHALQELAGAKLDSWFVKENICN